ncbi:hypothetical protein [Brevundimonas diminuta]|uniref:hypothetical protein n=1 Tax=Brevundimonas diminuta TaxID=293 RepID=UPI0025A4EC97|nr:hypothetical protein [Brevundimonas diminuta]MDM8352848.1 hypothetical protein [Brevundimonas diminuta]
MTADLSALIARLEAAEEVTRDLAVEFAAFMYADPEAFKGAVNYDPELWVERNQSPLCSLDAALALAERVHGEAYALDLLQDLVDLNDTAGLAIRDLPRLLCSFTLRAKLDGYAAEGEVNKNPKAQEG